MVNLKSFVSKCVRFILISIIVSVDFVPISGQCTPPPAETCEETIPFCSLDQMNGYTCTNPSVTVNTKNPGCLSCCDGRRTWWSFVSQGGNATITFNVGPCTNCPCNGGIV